MNIDFALILVLATLTSGLIWGGYAVATRGQGSERAEPVVVEYARSFFPVLLVVLILRSFVAEPFRIPSSSMMPTLLTGDFILVNKFSYGIRLPVSNTLIIPGGQPQRGDVMVFRYPEDPRIDYIKRVVGLPGDRVEYVNKVLYVNGERIDPVPAGSFVGRGAAAAMTGSRLFTEQLDQREYQVMHIPDAPSQNFSVIIPEGEYFVIGDNRDNSRDSRFWGTVDESLLVGRAFLIWMHWDSSGGSNQWSRIGTRIR